MNKQTKISKTLGKWKSHGLQKDFPIRALKSHERILWKVVKNTWSNYFWDFWGTALVL